MKVTVQREDYFLTFKSILKENQILVPIMLTIFIFIIGGILNRNFLSPYNIGSTLSMAVLLGFAAAGQTLVVISGGESVDLSVGAVMSLGAVVAGELMQGQNSAILPALLVVLLVGGLIGILNAIGVIIYKVPALVMTLAMSSVIIIMQNIYTGGTPTGKPAEILIKIGSKRLFPFLPWLVMVGIAMVILMHYFLHNTSYGHMLYSVGSNETAAYLSGVRTKLVRGAAFMLCGMLSALAGFWLIGYNNFVFVNMGVSYGLPSIAAVVIGGTSLAGGRGSYLGTMFGALVLSALASLLVVLRTGEAGRQIINGLVLALLLAIYTREPSIKQ